MFAPHSLYVETTARQPRSTQFMTTVFPGQCYFWAESTFRTSRMKSGKSAGDRDVTRLPSTTTDWSTQIAPAFDRSSLIVRWCW